MKNNYWIGLITGGLICISSVVYFRIPEKEKLPSFQIESANQKGSSFNTSDLPKGMPIALIYFNPDCEDCQEETKNIISRIGDLKKIIFCYVSDDSLSNVKNFYNYYKLNKYPNIFIGRDSSYSFIKYFKPKGTPTIVLFNKRKETFAYMTGKIAVDTILNYINAM